MIHTFTYKESIQLKTLNLERKAASEKEKDWAGKGDKEKVNSEQKSARESEFKRP